MQRMNEADRLSHFFQFFSVFPDFIAQLDQSCGTLTLHSSLKDLVKYTQAGLDYLAKERESLNRARQH